MRGAAWIAVLRCRGGRTEASYDEVSSVFLGRSPVPGVAIWRPADSRLSTVAGRTMTQLAVSATLDTFGAVCSEDQQMWTDGLVRCFGYGGYRRLGCCWLRARGHDPVSQPGRAQRPVPLEVGHGWTLTSSGACRDSRRGAGCTLKRLIRMSVGKQPTQALNRIWLSGREAGDRAGLLRLTPGHAGESRERETAPMV